MYAQLGESERGKDENTHVDGRATGPGSAVQDRHLRREGKAQGQKREVAGDAVVSKASFWGIQKSGAGYESM